MTPLALLVLGAAIGGRTNREVPGLEELDALVDLWDRCADHVGWVLNTYETEEEAVEAALSWASPNPRITLHHHTCALQRGEDCSCEPFKLTGGAQA